MAKQGNIVVNSENIMPIIKKWLYSDKDIFLRELVSNASDAITKFKKLIELGSAASENENYKIEIYTDKENKTLKIVDNGIGMTEDEVEKYITQVAFSGAEDFVKQYEKAGADGIIGHFGLGFYSAYMVADKIVIETRSYKEGAKAVRWESDGNSTYEISDSEKNSRGTEITLYLNEAETEFSQPNTVAGLIKKYCAFMPYEIYLNSGDGENKPLNDVHPLWLKDSKECTDEDYEKFYTEVFNEYDKPLFWIHLNVEFPFKLKGILFFPKQKNKLEINPGQIKLYCNQVYIADNVKEIIPEFLMILKGVIDCPDIPLNVSRSFLQNDREVAKISKHITKKVADKLNTLFNNDRKKYEDSWEDIAPFVKFGALKDEEFYDKVKDVILYKDLDGNYKTFNEFIDGSEETKIYYVQDEDRQAPYVEMFRNNGMKAMILNHYIDTHFISFLEYKTGKYKFARIDSELDGALKSEGELKNSEEIIKIFAETIDDKNITVKAENFKDTQTPAVINLPEYARRFKEMNSLYGFADEALKELTLVVNCNCPLVQQIINLPDDKKSTAVMQIFDLAKLAHKPLNKEEIKNFISRNLQILDEYVK